jgi:hypothetical protein
MLVGWASLTVCAKVGVVTDCALVAVASDVRRLATTERSVAINAVMTNLAEVGSIDLTNGLVNRNEAMAWVDKTGVDNACRTVVPIWAVKALVTDTIDILKTVSVMV